MIYSFALALLLLTQTIFACDGFFPPNNLSIPVNDKNEGLSFEEFNSVIDQVSSTYKDVVTNHGGELAVTRDWESPTVNAGTWREGKFWKIILYGGMARHKEMTKDALALVLCHEIGHHLGGAPKKIFNNISHWSSTEGQADYWATLKCLRRVFEKEDQHSEIANSEIPQEVDDQCKSALCKRISLASEAISKINASGRSVPPPHFETPDTTIVAITYDAHPATQCRLDTLFHGALCPINWKQDVSQLHEGPGTCHPMEGYQKGIRPHCWYKSTRR
jgi:hypothetical protein